MENARRPRRFPRTALLLVLALCLFGAASPVLVPPSQAQEVSLCYLQFMGPAPGLPANVEVWDRFWLDEQEVLLISASNPTIDLPSRTASWGTIEMQEAQPLFVVYAPRGLDLPSLRARSSVLLQGYTTALIQTRQEDADRLAEQGTEVRAVLPPPDGKTSATLHPPLTQLAADARIQEMINRITPASIQTQIGNLSGTATVSIGGEPYTIRTRNSYQTGPIQKATQYALEYLQDRGLGASYDDYSLNGYNWRNVVATQTGAVHPENIYVICGHLDDMPGGATAPGADDNASGSAAVLLAANALRDTIFQNTIQYVLFTGEEQGLYGSYYYVQKTKNNGKTILGALNFDMIAYDKNADGHLELHCGTISASGAMGDLFINTVSTYALPLSPAKFTFGSATASDHARFWNAGVPALLGIEDTNSEFNPNYHTTADTLANCNLSFATGFVQAAVGTLARLAQIDTPAMNCTPTLFVFSGIEAGFNPPSQALSIQITGSPTLPWNVSTSAPWLSVTPPAGTGSATTNVTAEVVGLAAGTHHATLTVTATEADRSPQTIPVVLQLTPSTPQIAFTPTSFSFSTFVGGSDPPTQMLQIGNAGTGSLVWSVSDDAAWLSLTPTGESGSGTVMLWAKALGLSQGSYAATITIQAAGAGNSPQFVPVSFQIDPPPQISLDPAALNAAMAQGGPNPTLSAFRLSNVGSGTIHWSASANVPWLTVSPTSGTAPASLQCLLRAETLASGTYTATVMVTSVEAVNSPAILRVSLIVEDAQVQQSLRAGWNLISLGLRTQRTPADLFGVEFRAIFRWDSLQSRYAVPNALEPGQGYWVRMNRPVTATITGTTVLSPWSGHCAEGWNQFGNPYPQAIPWSGMQATYQGKTQSLAEACFADWIGAAYSWTGTGYRSADYTGGTLEGGEGFWLKVNVPDLTLTIP